MKKISIALLVVIASFIIPNVAFASIDTNLKYGSSGAGVTELQEFLIEKGFLTGQASGNFYSLTRKAVITYQASIGLPPTGFVGSLTRAKINADLADANGPSITAEIKETNKGISSNKTSVFPVGCNSAAGFSTKTGQLCNGITNPSPNTPVPVPTPAPVPAPNPAPTPVVVINICKNIEGVQSRIPDGMTGDANGDCQPIQPASDKIQASNVNITTDDSSAQIQWTLNNPTNTRVTISGGDKPVSMTYTGVTSSTNGYSANVNGLNYLTTYFYEIEALENGFYKVKDSGQFITKAYFVADIVSDKTIIKNNGSDYATITVTIKLSSGETLPNKTVQINKIPYTSDSNGIIIYRTTPQYIQNTNDCNSPYPRGISIVVSDGKKIYEKTIQTSNQPAPTRTTPSYPCAAQA